MTTRHSKVKPWTYIHAIYCFLIYCSNEKKMCAWQTSVDILCEDSIGDVVGPSGNISMYFDILLAIV